MGQEAPHRRSNGRAVDPYTPTPHSPGPWAANWAAKDAADDNTDSRSWAVASFIWPG